MAAPALSSRRPRRRNSASGPDAGMRSILILIPYFGRWPEWFPLYLESCRANPSVHWRFFTDCPLPPDPPPNVGFERTDFGAYCERVSQSLGIDLKPARAYKVCDLRPAFGEIHAEAIAGYDYYGYGDIDVIYGDIRRFYDDRVLSHLCVSSHWDRCSGHFTLLRNLPLVRSAFRRIPRWRERMANPEYQALDESKFAKVFLRHRKHPDWLRRLYRFLDPLQGRSWFREQHTTILSPKPWWDGSLEHPEVWYWRQGRLTNARDGDREFPYLHFMNWKSASWLPKFRGERAAWEGLERLNHVPPGREGEGVRIDRSGFHPLGDPAKRQAKAER